MTLDLWAEPPSMQSDVLRDSREAPNDFMSPFVLSGRPRQARHLVTSQRCQLPLGETNIDTNIKLSTQAPFQIQCNAIIEGPPTPKRLAVDMGIMCPHYPMNLKDQSTPGFRHNSIIFDLSQLRHLTWLRFPQYALFMSHEQCQ